MSIDTLKPPTWTDRRPITALHLCGSQFKLPDNPQGWNWAMLRDNTPQLDEYADAAIEIMIRLNAQGCIAWDLCGLADYDTAGYLGSPDIAATINPQLAAAYDKFFRKIRYAGYQLKVGVCIRAGEFNPATKQLEDSPDPYLTAKRKVAYARGRWGCRLYYVDTNFNGAWGGGLLPSTVFARLRKAFPDCLFIIEHTYQTLAPSHVSVYDRSQWLNAVPYVELRGGGFGPPDEVLADIPGAFNVINVSAGDIRGNAAALKTAFKAGNIPMVNGWAPGDPQIDELLQVMRD
jgi:hypothetical protein